MTDRSLAPVAAGASTAIWSAASTRRFSRSDSSATTIVECSDAFDLTALDPPQGDLERGIVRSTKL